MPARAEYRALKTILYNGVPAYHEGYDVYQSAVDNLGLVVGEDVEPAGEGLVEKPAKNASRAAWVAYAFDQGVTDLDDLGRDEIIALFDEPVEEPDEE